MKHFFSPLLGLSIFSIASGYLITLIPLRLTTMPEGDDVMAGFMGAIYYAGLLAGSFRTEKTVIRIGHIRSFAAFMALLCASTLSLALFSDVYSWLLLRFLNGLAIAGIFVVIESWLLCESDHSNRGRILAFYMVALYGSNAVGQLLIGLYDITSLLPFIIIGGIFSLSILPPALTKLPTPTLEDATSLSLKALAKLTPSGLLGCISGGMILGALYSLLPIQLAQSNDDGAIGVYMAITMLGGMLLQYPVGYLSDFIDRRKVLVAVSFFGTLSCIAFILFANNSWIDGVLLFLIGGATFTIYPVAISHGCDHLNPEMTVAGTQGLLLGYSGGACLGPIFGGYFMECLSHGLMLYFIAMTSATGLFFLIRISYRPIIYSAEEQSFVAIPRTTPVVAQIDPRADVASDFDSESPDSESVETVAETP